jgi:glutathione reductase (NADPH)
VVHSGVDIKRGVQVATVKKTSEGIVVTLDNGEVLPPVDVLLWAVGRSPNTEGLGCDEINMSLSNQGHIMVDDFQNTNLSGVYALGDVAGKVSHLTI